MGALRSTLRRLDAGLAAVHDKQRHWHPGVRVAWWVLALPLAIAAAAGAAVRPGRKALSFALAGFAALVFVSAAVSPPEDDTTGVAADGTTTSTTEATTTSTVAPTTTTVATITSTSTTTTTTTPPTTAAAIASTTTTTRRPATTTTTRPPATTAAPAAAGRCTASVDNPHPTRNQTITVLVESNVPSTPFTATAHYKSLDTLQQGTTGGSGAGAVSFMTSGATSGYTVDIDVSISGKATCSTSFTPQ
jgi:hypothetical protein